MADEQDIIQCVILILTSSGQLKFQVTQRKRRTRSLCECVEAKTVKTPIHSLLDGGYYTAKSAFCALHGFNEILTK